MRETNTHPGRLQRIQEMIRRDYASIVTILLLLLLLLWSVGEAQDAVNLCDQRYAPIVNQLYDKTGSLPIIPTINDSTISIPSFDGGKP